MTRLIRSDDHGIDPSDTPSAKRSAKDAPSANGITSQTRRRVIRISAAAAASASGLVIAAPGNTPAAGDRLVADDAEGVPTPLRLQDLATTTKPLLAYPFDVASKTIKNESRLNKIVLLRFAESDLDAETRKRAVKGVLAFSAICTHQACDLKTWLAKEKALVCFCHASKFLPLELGQVANGPATRSLPTLPLTEEGGQLVIAGPFSGKTGGTA